MLSRLSIRDIVLIDRLDIDFAAGLAVLTGETGAGKSILLDAFALALGARGDQALVRQGAEQGQVTAVFEVAARPSGARAAQSQRHRRRGRTDPAPRAVRRRPHPRLRQRPAGERAGAEAARHRAGRDPRPARRPRAGRCRHPPPPARRLRRAGGRCGQGRGAVGGAPRGAGRGATPIAPRSSAPSAKATVCAMRSRNSTSSAPQAGEETALADRRTTMMQAEKVAEDLRDAHDVIAGANSPVPALRRRHPPAGAARRAGAGPGRAGGEGARRRAHRARGDARPSRAGAAHRRFRSGRAGTHRGAAVRAARGGPQIQCAGRRSGGAGAQVQRRSRADRCRRGEAQGAGSGRRARPRPHYRAAAEALSKARAKAAAALDKAVNGELKPLKLERAKFSTEIDSDAAAAGPNGIDRVEFWVQTNPGTRPGPLMKVASGGELARFLLALKVVLADRGSAPTLVFDEIDTGVGGAVADAIGVRLARLAARRAGAGGDACAAGRGARRPALRHHQGRARQGQARRHPRHRGGRRAPPRGDRPHAGRRRDHRRGPRRRRTADQGGGRSRPPWRSAASPKSKPTKRPSTC